MQKVEIEEIDRVAIQLSKIPGIGLKSAKRYAVWLGEHKQEAKELISKLESLTENVKSCKKCFNLTTSKESICSICKDLSRDHSTICVVQSLENLVEIEQSGVYNGVYYILGGLISALYSTDEVLNRVEYLKKRVKKENLKEVILVLSSTAEGELTIHYIKEQLKDTGVRISRVASGVPIGTDINYIDKRTLVEALRARVYI